MTSWLITGGTGSFGNAFTKRLLDDPDTERVAILSRDELKQAEMAARFPDKRMRFMIGSVTDMGRVTLALRGIDHVVHAAALKRVETCELNPYEALETNTLGSWAVARACIAAGVRRAVILSTDKAVSPNTLYGVTKLGAERMWIHSNVYAAGTRTRFSATRYGNVIGSRGSVIGLWRRQAERGDPVTVTDPNMTRFWMRMSDAIDLVLLAFREMRGGEVFVPKVASSSIATLAAAISGNGYEVLGPRPGEKKHEVLVSEDEARDTYDYGDHYRIEPHRTWEDDVMRADVRVPAGFTYRSDTSPVGVDAIKALVS